MTNYIATQKQKKVNIIILTKIKLKKLTETKFNNKNWTRRFKRQKK